MHEVSLSQITAVSQYTVHK